ncbi:major facilitator superfamily domain-containing protein [Rhypophila decipiens]|uniref:Major facilitator superfamily domain-containing protein n=1 Tax=Rhypophila decipiens TaxID=261697 RepID=A0AAN6YPI9_9PEZI|nr:major facilitator superfamily domain-containing protein [Rhypophila decipiens]
MKASKTAVFSLGTVFSLSATVFQQPVAELSHVLGRKPAFLFVLAMFFAGSVVAAMAKDMITLLVGRAMQGFACGGSVLAAIILTDLIELKDRATWLAYQNGIQALGLTWLFWINLPAIVVSAVGLGLLLGFDRPNETYWESMAKVDWIGMLIFIPSAVAVLVPFAMAGIIFQWASLSAFVPLVLGIFGLTCLGVHQKYIAKRPMFRARLFTKPVTVYSFIGQAVFGICLNMIFYYLVVYWSGVRGYDEIITGLCLLPETITIPLAAVVCGLVMRRTDRIRVAMLVGWPLTTLSIGLLWYMDAQTPLGVLLLINGLVGLGAGIIVSAMNVTLLASTKKADNGHAIAMGIMFKSTGMSLGVAIGTAVFTARMDSLLDAGADTELVAESFMRMLHGVKDDPAVQEIIVSTLRILWLICCGLALVAGVLCVSCRYPGFHDNDEHLPEHTQRLEGVGPGGKQQQ